MKTLIVEDDFTCRLVLQGLLAPLGECHLAVNGLEAVEASAEALMLGKPYQLICMDIMMPQMDGQESLRQIRADEQKMGIRSSQGAKVIMTTALDDVQSIMKAFHGLCDAYLPKPIEGKKLFETIERLGLLPAAAR